MSERLISLVSNIWLYPFQLIRSRKLIKYQANAVSKMREVPSFDVVFSHEKQSRFAIVIPVINEGARIRSLLDKISLSGIDRLADVLIVDGGSKDGSLEIEWLLSRGVRGLLVKTGPGKLSAQLRCAYSFVVDKGYDGVVTIDGNDKDDRSLFHVSFSQFRKEWTSFKLPGLCRRSRRKYAMDEEFRYSIYSRTVIEHRVRVSVD